MNERIKELKDQCYISIINRDGDNPYDMEKFAQLIVRECAKIIEAQDVDPSFKNRLSWAMKDKFGVK
jgi:hypothetical protein